MNINTYITRYHLIGWWGSFRRQTTFKRDYYVSDTSASHSTSLSTKLQVSYYIATLLNAGYSMLATDSSACCPTSGPCTLQRFLIGQVLTKFLNSIAVLLRPSTNNCCAITLPAPIASDTSARWSLYVAYFDLPPTYAWCSCHVLYPPLDVYTPPAR